MEEEQVKKKKIILISSITIVALILVVGISYALWQQTRVQEGTNYIASGCFGVQFEGNNPINLANSFPITTEDGMKTTPYTFTITNTCNGKAAYDVNLESLSNTTFQNTSIRVALDETNKLYSEYSEAEPYYNDSVESRRLISGRLEANESVTYTLRIWIDEAVTIEEQNKTFASKIVVNASEDFDDPEIIDLNATSTIDTINIIYNANGDISTTCKWGIEAGTYDNEVVDATNTNCTITGLTDNTTYYYQICTETGKGSKCVDGSIKTKTLSDLVKIGDYISMTPTATSYSIATSVTGYTSTQTINPSELNLWRVIRKNDDGTVDMVSEYVSNKEIYLNGSTGWMKAVGTLDMIASQYTNSKYVSKTRHMGYSNQVKFCTHILECYGDTSYQADTNLVKNVVGTLIGKNVNGKESYYWLASRHQYTQGTTSFMAVRAINKSGEVTGGVIYYNTGSSYEFSHAIRPIVTLKSSVEISSGKGTSASPYTLK